MAAQDVPETRPGPEAADSHLAMRRVDCEALGEGDAAFRPLGHFETF